MHSSSIGRIINEARKTAILSMGKQDLKERVAFLNDLARVLRGYGFPNGAPEIDESGKVWTFYEDVPNKSASVFSLTLGASGMYNYKFKLSGKAKSGAVSSPIELFSLLPKRSV